MPERKCVTGMKAAVPELVHAGEPAEDVELRELARAADVEEPVAVERAGRPPHHHGEERA
jgi:hypothetical protein